MQNPIALSLPSQQKREAQGGLSKSGLVKVLVETWGWLYGISYGGILFGVLGLVLVYLWFWKLVSRVRQVHVVLLVWPLEPWRLG